MRRLIGLLVLALALVVAGVGIPPAAAAERTSPAELLVYSAPAADCPGEGRNLVVAGADGGAPEVVASCVDGAEPPSPDGERLAAETFTATTSPARVTQAETVVYATDNGCRTDAAGGDDIDWAPDGRRVVAARYRSYGDNHGLWVTDLQRPATGSSQLIRQQGIRWPSLHPTNGTIAFTVERSGADHDIELVGAFGTGRRPLFSTGADDRAPAFSPDGAQLAFIRDGRPWVAGAGGADPRQVADVEVRSTLSWSPGGELVVALADGIATVDVADGDVTRLTTGDHLDPHLFVRKGRSGSDGYALLDARGDATSFGAFCGDDLSRNRAVGGPDYIAGAANPARTQAWYLRADGVVEPTGSQPPLGNAPRGAPVVGIASTASGKGYWVVASNGAVYAFGDATFHGSMERHRLNQPIVGMAVTPSGGGYWLVASDGGIFRFGDAGFFGSTGSMRLNKPIVGMAPTSSGNGYWLFAADGGVFTFGDARFFGSTGALRLNAPVFAMASTTSDGGYWLFARDGGVFTFGGARFHGSLGDQPDRPRTIGALNRGTTASAG